MKIIKIVPLIYILFLATLLNGQVSDVKFFINSENNMVISYVLNPEEKPYHYDIDVKVSAGLEKFDSNSLTGDYKNVKGMGKKEIIWDIISDIDEFEKYLISNRVEFDELIELEGKLEIDLIPKFKRTIPQYITLVTNDKAQSIQGIYVGYLFSSFKNLNGNDATKFPEFFDNDSLTSIGGGYIFQWITRRGSKYSFEFKSSYEGYHNESLDFSYSKALFPFLPVITTFVGFGFGNDDLPNASIYDAQSSGSMYYLISTHIHPRNILNGYIEYKKSLSSDYTYDELTLGISLHFIW